MSDLTSGIFDAGCLCTERGVDAVTLGQFCLLAVSEADRQAEVWAPSSRRCRPFSQPTEPRSRVLHSCHNVPWQAQSVLNQNRKPSTWMAMELPTHSSLFSLLSFPTTFPRNGLPGGLLNEVCSCSTRETEGLSRGIINNRLRWYP